MATQGIRLFVFDLDGTALGGHVPYGQFPRPFCRFLDGLAARGILWATNTTWSIEHQASLVVHSPVKSRPVFLSASTGRALGTLRNDELVVDETHARMVQARDRRFRTRHWPMIRRVALELLRADLVDGFAFNNLGQNMITFSVRRKRDVAAVWRVLAPLLDSGAFESWWPPGRPKETLLPAYMNKGTALAYMQKRLGIGPVETLIAGDGINDRHMFDRRFARWMVCPANAEPAIKEATRRAGGVVSERQFCWGVMDGAKRVLGSCASSPE